MVHATLLRYACKSVAAPVKQSTPNLMMIATGSITLSLPDLHATATLATALGRTLRAGDVVTLSGDLGSGKTTLVRLLLESLYGEAVEVPSPTFTLVQTYLLPSGVTLWHFDLYRLSRPEDVQELGWDEADGGIRIVEWPDRLGPLLPECHLDIALAFSGKGLSAETGRTVLLSGFGDWGKRGEALRAILKDA